MEILLKSIPAYIKAAMGKQVTKTRRDWFTVLTGGVLLLIIQSIILAILSQTLGTQSRITMQEAPEVNIYHLSANSRILLYPFMWTCAAFWFSMIRFLFLKAIGIQAHVLGQIAYSLAGLVLFLLSSFLIIFYNGLSPLTYDPTNLNPIWVRTAIILLLYLIATLWECKISYSYALQLPNSKAGASIIATILPYFLAFFVFILLIAITAFIR